MEIKNVNCNDQYLAIVQCNIFFLGFTLRNKHDENSFLAFNLLYYYFIKFLIKKKKKKKKKIPEKRKV